MTLSTHVLDTTHGVPARGIRLRLFSGDQLLFEDLTNDDGRCPKLKDIELLPGRFRLEFEVASYFRKMQIELTDPPFLDIVRVDFGISSTGGHYHVPLLVSPFGYSTYRGS